MQRPSQWNVIIKSKVAVQESEDYVDKQAVCIILYRMYGLSGVSLQPDWIPSVSVASAHNQIYFSLQLMTGMITLT